MARHVSPNVPTVLLVDDPHDDRQMYAEYLRLQRFRAVEIGDTAHALALAPATDVVVTGIRVPGPFDGLELVRRLRAHEPTKLKPVIVLTACVFQGDQERAHAAGCDLFLPKPCLPDTLVAEIRRTLTMWTSRPPRARRAGLNGRRQDVT